MIEELAIEILEKLKSGELEEYLVSKDEFFSFRQCLSKEKISSIIAGLLKEVEMSYTNICRTTKLKGDRDGSPFLFFHVPFV